MNLLENKTALITGAASGMGKAIAQLFASEGAKLLLADVNADGLNAIVAAINKTGATAIGFAGDISKEDEVEKMFQTALLHFRGVDILVNNAGVLDNFMPVAEISTSLWNKVMGINLNGPFYTCRLAVPSMLKQGGGSIINISSVGGFCGARAGAAYTSSKHALIGLTKNIAYYYGDKGIRCNAIAPGGVNTNIGAGMQPNELGYAKLSLGMQTNIRIGEPSEIAEVALFLASNKSGLINGSVIVADAGWTSY